MMLADWGSRAVNSAQLSPGLFPHLNCRRFGFQCTAAFDPIFSENMRDMIFHRAFLHSKDRADFPIRQPLPYKFEDFSFTRSWDLRPGCTALLGFSRQAHIRLQQIVRNPKTACRYRTYRIGQGFCDLGMLDKPLNSKRYEAHNLFVWLRSIDHNESRFPEKGTQAANALAERKWNRRAFNNKNCRHGSQASLR